MPIHLLKLLERAEVARGTTVFVFSKPEGLHFKPGQYGGFTLINPPETDAGGITRRFSLLSTPDDPYLCIATRILEHSAFKRVLNSLPIESEIKFAGPTGNFTLHDDPTIPAVLIAGGIGIAPFYSMIKNAAARQSKQKIYLFYGNTEPNTTAFLDELATIEKSLPSFKLIATMDTSHPDWHGETGYIDDSLIKKYIPDLFTPQYYVCGSPAMVTAIQETLAEMDINEDKIHTEDFPGY